MVICDSSHRNLLHITCTSETQSSDPTTYALHEAPQEAEYCWRKSSLELMAVTKVVSPSHMDLQHSQPRGSLFHGLIALPLLKEPPSFKQHSFLYQHSLSLKSKTKIFANKNYPVIFYSSLANQSSSSNVTLTSISLKFL